MTGTFMSRGGSKASIRGVNEEFMKTASIEAMNRTSKTEENGGFNDRMD